MSGTRIVRFLVRRLGLSGSWIWACRKLDNGAAVRSASAKGSVQYRLDNEAQRRLEWRFGESDKWHNANFFLSNMDRTDWTIVTPTPKAHNENKRI